MPHKFNPPIDELKRHLEQLFEWKSDQVDLKLARFNDALEKCPAVAAAKFGLRCALQWLNALRRTRRGNPAACATGIWRQEFECFPNIFDQASTYRRFETILRSDGAELDASTSQVLSGAPQKMWLGKQQW